MKYVLVSLILFFSIFTAFSQKKFTISGKVLEAKNQESLPFVNVYFQGSTIGSQTDENGNFKINNVPAGKYRLVASMVSFKPQVQVLIVNSDMEVVISLEDDIMALKELKIVGKRDKDWERNFKEFSLEFLGKNFKKNEVLITNKEVVNFERNGSELKATANEPIVVENKVLGYKLFFILEYFEKDSRTIKINGIPRFEILSAKDEKQQLLWEKNKRSAYNGSLKHLFKSMLYGQLKYQNFQCQYLPYNPDNHLFNEKIVELGKGLTFIDSNAVFRTNQENVYIVDFQHRLAVKYWNGNKWLERSMLKQQVPIELDEKGNVLNPFSVEIEGDMSERRMAKLLPFDFEVTDEFPNQNFKIDPIPVFLENIYKEPREKIEISGLNPFYFSSESLQVKFQSKLLLNGNNSLISIPLYVDLIGLENGKLVKHFKLKLEESKVDFAFQIPPDLATGNYQLRAYTNWMRNYSDEGFGQFNFVVFGSNFQDQIPQNLEAKLDTVIIHTEGNSDMVQNLKSRILIESKDNFGKEFSTTYKILNSQNEEILSGETDSLGLDFIEITPLLKDSYKLLASGKTFSFPKVLETGIVMTIDNVSNQEKLRVWIQNTDLKTDSLLFTIIKNGKLEYFKSIQNKLKSYIFQVEKPDFASEFTAILFDKNFKVLSERKVIVSDTINETFLIENKKSFVERPAKSSFYDRKYDYETNLSIEGTVRNKKGKDLYKTVDLALWLSDETNDSSKNKPLIFYTKTDDKFKFDKISFFGERRLEYFSEDASVTIDTALNIPEIKKIKFPINWQLVGNYSTDEGLLKRVTNIKSYKISQNNVLQKSFKNDLANILSEDAKPSFILKELEVAAFPNVFDLLEFLRKERCDASKKVKVAFNNILFDLNKDTLNGFPISMLSEAQVYSSKNMKLEDCDFVFVLKLKNKINLGPKSNDIIYEGYYK